MPNYVPVSRERHADQSWTKFSSYAFAAQTAVAPLVAAELPKAMMAMPLGFIRVDGAVMPAAILSLEPNRNLYVSVQGQWMGAYVPSAFRSYPFRLLSAQNSQMVLCVDEDSGLVGEGPQGEAIFGADGELSGEAKQVVDFLTQVEGNRQATARAAAALDAKGVIKPWELKVKTDQGERPVEGLFKVDEASLNALPLDDFGELRSAGALVLAYCQMLSMQNVAVLGKLAQAHQQQMQQKPKVPALDSVLAPANDGDLDIDWSQFSAAPYPERK